MRDIRTFGPHWRSAIDLRPHDGLDERDQHALEERKVEVGAQVTGGNALGEELAELARDHLAACFLDDGEAFGSRPAQVVDEHGRDLAEPLAEEIEDVVEFFSEGALRGDDPLQFAVYPGDALLDDGFEESVLAVEVRVERFLAHPEFASEFVHRNAAETRGEENLLGGFDDSEGDAGGW